MTRFHEQVETNLSGLCGPMHFSAIKIVSARDIKSKERLLDIFFKNTLNPNIYKLGNREIINLLIANENAYTLFKETRGTKEWNSFWSGFTSFQKYLEKEYWRNFNVLYSDYRWLQHMVPSNIFIKCWHEIIHFLFQAFQFGVIASGFFVYLSIWDKFTSKKFPDGSINFTLQLFLITVIIYCIFIMIGASVRGLKTQKDPWSSNLRKWRVPWLMAFLDR